MNDDSFQKVGDVARQLVKKIPRPKIIAAGIYQGISLDAYHGGGLCDGPSISSSGLRTIFNESPADYWLTSPYNPHRQSSEETEAMTLGKASHHLFMGEDAFRAHYIVRPEVVAGKPWQGNRTDCKAWLAERKAEGYTVITPAQIEVIRGMAGLLPWQKGQPDYGLMNSPLIQSGALNGQIERTLAWRDAETGVWLLSRPDVIPNDSGDYIDLKTVASVDFLTLSRALDDGAYNMQAALVGMAAREVLKRPMASFTLVFVSKKPPHIVRFRTIEARDIECGEKQVRVALRTFLRCMERKQWPGPDDDAAYISLSERAQTRIDHRLKALEQELAA